MLTIWLTADDPLGLVGSNPTPGAIGLTHDGSSELGEIVSFGLWMEKQGYLAQAEFSKSRKSKLVEDLARFYRWKNTPFDYS